jgi:uncharacterized protein (TIGR02145 family)
MNNIFRISGVILLILSIFLIHSCKKDKPTPPVLTTTAISAITKTTGASGGNIISDGGTTVVSRGVCWSTNNTPTLSDNKTLDGAGVGSFVSAITGLTAGTTYFVRAYATNDSETGYGMAMSFTTQPAIIPTLTTAGVTSITQNTAICGGTITSDGAASITARGICFSTNHNPTIIDSKTTDGSGTGSFTSTISGLIASTTYYVRAYATNSAGSAYGIEISFTTLGPPSVTTSIITGITLTSASSGGNITANNGGSVLARGVCWSTSTNPTITNNKTTDGAGTGTFISDLTGLIANTKYYVRAYATNDFGTSYGNELIIKTYTGTVIDINGNIYYTTSIGSQEWIADNLRTTKYANGDLIGSTTLDISSEATPKYQWAYNDNESNVATYGLLYTWYAITDIRKVCPIGWHIPTDAEWTILTDYLTNNGYGFQGSGIDIGKSMSATYGWNTSTRAGDVGNDRTSNNSSCFTAFPAGFRDQYGSFGSLWYYCSWWSSTEYSTTNAFKRYIFYNNPDVGRSNDLKSNGYSVRCVKD